MEEREINRKRTKKKKRRGRRKEKDHGRWSTAGGPVTKCHRWLQWVVNDESNWKGLPKNKGFSPPFSSYLHEFQPGASLIAGCGKGSRSPSLATSSGSGDGWKKKNKRDISDLKIRDLWISIFLGFFRWRTRLGISNKLGKRRFNRSYLDSRHEFAMNFMALGHSGGGDRSDKFSQNLRHIPTNSSQIFDEKDEKLSSFQIEPNGGVQLPPGLVFHPGMAAG